MNNENNNLGNQMPNNNQAVNNQQFMNQTFQQPVNSQPVNQVQQPQVQPMPQPQVSVQPQVNNQMNYQQPMYNQPVNNGQVNMPPQMPSNFNPNQPQKTPKKTKFIIIGIVVAILLVLAIIIVPLLVGINEDAKVRANKNIQNLYLYVPENWKQLSNNQFESESGVCQMTAGILTIDYNQAYTGFETMYSGKFVKKTLNEQEWDYLNAERGSEAIHLYMVDNSYGKYSIILYSKSTTDEECNKYLEDLENSIKLEKK